MEVRLEAQGRVLLRGSLKPDARVSELAGVEPLKSGVGMGSVQVVGMSSGKDAGALSPAQCHIHL